MRDRLTYANVMSTLAAFLALAGGSVAIGAALKKNSVKSKQVKNEALTNKDLKDGKAVGASEVTDGSLGSADIADGAIGAAKIAAGAVGAAQLADPEPFTLVGSGGILFGNGGEGDCLWSNSASPDAQPLAFYKDSDGVVHIEGSARSANGPGGDGACDGTGGPAAGAEDMRIFTLPPGYRPDRAQQFAQVSSSGETLILIGADDTASLGGVLPAGAVVASPTSGITSLSGMTLSGITFRAAGPAG